MLVKITQFTQGRWRGNVIDMESRHGQWPWRMSPATSMPFISACFTTRWVSQPVVCSPIRLLIRVFINHRGSNQSQVIEWITGDRMNISCNLCSYWFSKLLGITLQRGRSDVGSRLPSENYFLRRKIIDTSCSGQFFCWWQCQRPRRI